MCVAMEDARPGLTHHTLNELQHPLELFAQPLQCNLLQKVRGLLHSLAYLLREPFRLSDHPARRVEQPAIALLQSIPIERPFRACYPRDLKQPQLHAPAAVAQLGSDPT